MAGRAFFCAQCGAYLPESVDNCPCGFLVPAAGIEEPDERTLGEPPASLSASASAIVVAPPLPASYSAPTAPDLSLETSPPSSTAPPTKKTTALVAASALVLVVLIGGAILYKQKEAPLPASSAYDQPPPTGAISTATPVAIATTGRMAVVEVPPFAQQGPKLVGSGAVGNANQGRSVSLSADGNTAIEGGSSDNNGAGAAWIWTRSGEIWTQQGTKLVGSGAEGGAHQSSSVSLSADGNTAIVGGPLDNGYVGAVWVWTRSGEVWTQQGTKLVSSGAGNAQQGTSVSLSADGNTAIVGGMDDVANAGAAWIWTRRGEVWTQQGTKLVGSGAMGPYARQGHSVSLSADGNTAMVGGPSDNWGAGAAWVWTRSGGVWTQQGAKLVGSGDVRNADQGWSVSLSADGNTANVGGDGDNGTVGAAWVWTRSGGVWTQQGTKLVGSDAVGNAQQGGSVSLSGDGKTSVVGGPFDDNHAGAAWVWTRKGGVWTQEGNKLVGSGAVGPAQQGWAISVSSDGNTAIIGGDEDNSRAGAAWVFARSEPSSPPLPLTDLVVNAQKTEGVLGQVTFSKKGDTLFYFARTPSTGRIVINETEYVLSKLSKDRNESYRISGEQVSISTSQARYADRGGDCVYGVFATVTITLNEVSTTLENVELQDCPDLDF